MGRGQSPKFTTPSGRVSKDEVYADKGKQIVQQIRDQLAGAGLGRTSTLSGGEITGFTRALGSTGWSVREEGNDLDFHVVISGRAAGLAYIQWEEVTDGEVMDFHEPVSPQKLHPRIKEVFQKMGFTVKKVETGGWQMHWDDDVSYNVLVDSPK